MKKLLIIILLCLASCKTTELVRTEVVEVPKIEHHYEATHSRDTIYNRDSIYVFEKGDTLTFHHYHTTRHVIERHDTVHHTDTLTVIEPIEITQVKWKEKEMTAWQITRIHLANMVLILIGGFLAIRLLIWWLKKKGKL